MPPHKISPPFYPIVYVRGYAMTEGERDDVFHDAYYGFSATSVEKRDAAPPKYFEVDIFEGQFIRLMKMKIATKTSGTAITITSMQNATTRRASTPSNSSGWVAGS